jgi:hypothetical protein
VRGEMTTNELTSVAIKVFAIYVLVHAILSIPSFVVTYSGLGFDRSIVSSEQLFWLLAISSIVLLLIITVFLWKLAGRVAEKVSSDVGINENHGKIDQEFLLSLLGIYLCVDAVIRFGFVCISAYTQAQHSDEIALQTIAYIVGYLFQIIVGLTLILKASGWIRIMNWLRGAGLTEKP